MEIRGGWEVGKLKDICERGTSNIAQKNIVDNNGEYPIYGAAGFIKNVDFYQQDKEYVAVVKDGAGVGRVSVLPAYSSIIGTMQYIIPKEGYTANFIGYCLQGLKLERFATGATIPHIYFRDYGECKIKIPPLPIQHQIVAELDILNAIIDKKREQLTELDNLAQATFYDMFGDPIDNEKGWEVKELGEVCEVRSGRNQRQVEDINGKYPIVGSGGIMGYANDYICPSNTVVLGRKGTINKPFLMTKKFWNVDTAFGLIANNSYLHSLYLYYFTKEFNFLILNVAVTIPSLRKTDLHKINIPIPPLPLQEEFAKKIELIEHQKELIDRSIADVQQLFDYTMDGYFG